MTPQPYIQPHPERFIPTEEEIAACLSALGFALLEGSAQWERDDGVILGDTHDRNFIRAPDASSQVTSRSGNFSLHYTLHASRSAAMIPSNSGWILESPSLQAIKRPMHQ